MGLPQAEKLRVVVSHADELARRLLAQLGERGRDDFAMLLPRGRS